MQPLELTGAPLLDYLDLENERGDLLLRLSSTLSPHDPFSITQAGLAGLVYYINRALDDGTLWYTGPASDAKSLQHEQVLQGVSGVVRLLPGTEEL